MRHKSGANRPFNGCSSQPRWSRPWLSLVCLGKLGFAVGHTRWVTRAGSALKRDKTRVKGKGPTRDGPRTADTGLACGDCGVCGHTSHDVSHGDRNEKGGAHREEAGALSTSRRRHHILEASHSM